ncbi:helix-turn-helix domain-containing protein [Paraglaciecola sp. 2405UD69-4]|uniref:helix-turn-helix domain-containing protein n=1 Tax=Paraglaciecola sp. 2405UD69-4 TaxID=3391836 RepID=UPI0039C9A01F
MSQYVAQQSSLCQHCAMSGMCFDKSNTKIVSKSRSHKIFHKTDALFRAGEKFDAIYILRSGSVKASLVSGMGQEQITGFYFPGDLLGLDGFETGEHSQTLKFLETSSVCRIAYSELDAAMANSSSIRFKLLQGMSEALNLDDKFILNSHCMNASQKFASFLLNLSEKFENRGLSSHIFDLSMSRVDIANYLGMAVETVSRQLTQLQKEQTIDVNKRRISILDIQRLHDCVNGDKLLSNQFIAMPKTRMSHHAIASY